ncbi:protein of unknown function [Streptococcus thermophilus]|uniref:Uncharacterized protein n=1 Tax=Streptococcus thermophilus TaxID=1308 RepID=A0A8D6U1V6_STRTR|nr:protein of unknown function [Streptococcus thermophilus]CAD0143780.1 protein of unknown function [Streptococcus thermophilus]CAD0151620.1 protein of unknown function [Streptococcus thermophilus]
MQIGLLRNLILDGYKQTPPRFNLGGVLVGNETISPLF